jgi:hypothetical protein
VKYLHPRLVALSFSSLFLVLTMLALCAGANAQDRAYYVAPTGNDSNSGTQASPWATIQKAIESFSLGSTGTVIHVAAGSYSNLQTLGTCASVPTNVCVDRDGTSSARLVIQCDQPTTGCKLVAKPTGGYAVVIEANYVDFVGFEVGPCAACNAGIAILGGSVFNNKGTSIHILNNYVHDIAQGGNDGNGFGTGCPSSGMIIADFKGQVIPGLQIIGNRVNNGGLMSLGSACNQFHGLYVSNATVIQNNLISNIVGQGINFGPSPCGGKISNNTVFHNGQRGILIANYSGNNCGSSLGSNTVNNNIVINNNVNNSGVCGIEEYSGGAGTNNLYAHNLLQGNSCGDSIRLTTSPSSAIQNLLHEATSVTFVSYSNDGSGDYHLKTGSAAIQSGTTSCTSGVSSCVPQVDMAGLTRPAPPSLGILEFGGIIPAAPTGLTARVQ